MFGVETVLGCHNRILRSTSESGVGYFLGQGRAWGQRLLFVNYGMQGW